MRSETRSAGRAMPPYGAALLLVVASRARALALALPNRRPIRAEHRPQLLRLAREARRRGGPSDTTGDDARKEEEGQEG